MWLCVCSWGECGSDAESVHCADSGSDSGGGDGGDSGREDSGSDDGEGESEGSVAQRGVSSPRVSDILAGRSAASPSPRRLPTGPLLPHSTAAAAARASADHQPHRRAVRTLDTTVPQLCLAWHSSCGLLYSGGVDGTVTGWDPVSLEERVRCLPGAAGGTVAGAQPPGKVPQSPSRMPHSPPARRGPSTQRHTRPALPHRVTLATATAAAILAVSPPPAPALEATCVSVCVFERV